MDPKKPDQNEEESGAVEDTESPPAEIRDKPQSSDKQVAMHDPFVSLGTSDSSAHEDRPSEQARDTGPAESPEEARAEWYIPPTAEPRAWEREVAPNAGAGNDGKQDDDPQGKVFLDQLYVTLETNFLAATVSGTPNADVIARLEDLFRQPKTWKTAYQIEQTLVLVMTDAQVASELDRRLDDLKRYEHPYAEFVAAARDDPQTDDEKRRELLRQAVARLQWFYGKRIRRRQTTKKMSLRVNALFLAAFLLFFLTLGLQFAASTSSDTDGENTDAAAGSGNTQVVEEPAPEAAAEPAAGGNEEPGETE